MAKGHHPTPGARMAATVTTGGAMAMRRLAAGSLLPAPRPVASNPVQRPHRLASVFRYVICKNKVIVISLLVKIFTVQSSGAADDEK